MALPALAFGASEDASNVGRGSPAQYVKVTGQGFSGEAHGSDVRVRIGEIRLESTGKLVATRYTALGIAVYREGKIIGAAWNHAVAGELTSAAPSVTMTGRLFVVPWVGPQCLKGGCEVRLQLRVETGSSDAHAEHTDFAALPVTAVKEAARPAPAPPKTAPRVSGQPAPSVGGPPRDWKTHLWQGVNAYSQNRIDEAERALSDSLFSIQKYLPGNELAEARVRYQLSLVHERQRKPAQQEQALLIALIILERHPDGEVQKTVGDVGGPLDKEIVARRLGDFYWEQRRYDKSYFYYDRAYRHVAEVQLSSYDRNLRLARSSAGRMAGACTQQNWAVADQAMKELKERIVHVDAETRKQLEYWVRTGEPRLAARKC